MDEYVPDQHTPGSQLEPGLTSPSAPEESNLSGSESEEKNQPEGLGQSTSEGFNVNPFDQPTEPVEQAAVPSVSAESNSVESITQPVGAETSNDSGSVGDELTEGTGFNPNAQHSLMESSNQAINQEKAVDLKLKAKDYEMFSPKALAGLACEALAREDYQAVDSLINLANLKIALRAYNERYNSSSDINP